MEAPMVSAGSATGVPAAGVAEAGGRCSDQRDGGCHLVPGYKMRSTQLTRVLLCQRIQVRMYDDEFTTLASIEMSQELKEEEKCE